MKHINLDTQDAAIQQFVLAASAEANGAVLELHGRTIAHVLPVAAEANGDQMADETWTEAKNARRCALIDQEIAGTLRPETAAELHRLQGEMLRHRRRVAPLPLEDARRLPYATLTFRIR